MMRVASEELRGPEVFASSGEPARPICFDGLAGMYHAAHGDTAVLLLSPWGFEELCSRMTYRLLGERFAALGYPCLRFDLPGTGHSTLASAEISDENSWRTAVCKACDHLCSLSQAQRVIVVGQGLGGLLAAHLAQQRPVSGLVLLAPATQGRGHLREIAAWTAMTKGEFKVSSTDGPPGGFMSAGFVLSAATVNEIRQLQPLGSLPAVVQRVLLATRPDNAADARLSEELSANGLVVETTVFADHADYVSSPIFGTIPTETLEKVANWVAQRFPATTGRQASVTVGQAVAHLDGDGYAESFFRFGPSDMFFGAFTRPASGPKTKTAVLILNAGADHSVGWGRHSVDLARDLARQGFSSMRIDQAGIGETPLWPGQQQPVMYSLRANDDVACAIDWMEAEAGIEQVVLLGRCSGGYPAFLSAVSDRRVVASVMINVRKLHWEPDEDILKAIRDPVEPVDTYRQNLRSTRQFKRILNGELKVSTVLRKLSRTLVEIAAKKLAPLFGNRSRHTRISRIVQARLQSLTARHVPVALIYSEGDPGLRDLQEWAGRDLAKLAAYPNVAVHVIEGADHNLSPVSVRSDVTNVIAQFLRGKLSPSN
ncbi:alpha-beta hydrolase superfamily lysophospholipase [Rhizobium sp. AG855]|nr:alpha-beta hydrolase superfamily lysophospholipase [Rhizobium sp. AG855]